MRIRKRHLLAGLALAVVSAGAVGVALSSGSSSHARLQRPHRVAVTVQLAWTTQARFAGYYAALARGFYRRAGLDVTIKPGGPDVVPEQVVLGRRAQFGVDWLPTLLALRDRGKDLVNIAQILARSGTIELTWKKSRIDSFGQMRGKTFGVWMSGNDLEQEAALFKYGLDPQKDVKLVDQGLSMKSFLERKIDAASAMTYDELAQVLETVNPRTGRPYRLSDLNVFRYQRLGTGVLQDGIFVDGRWIEDPRNLATARKFLAASFQGWVYCRSHVRSCVSLVRAIDPSLSRAHEAWELNEINGLIWPSRRGIGIVEPSSVSRTVRIARQFGLLKHPVDRAFRTDVARAAVRTLSGQGLDVHGKRWKKVKVSLSTQVR